MKNLILRLQCSANKFAADLEKVPNPPEYLVDCQRLHELTVELERAHKALVKCMNQPLESSNATTR